MEKHTIYIKDFLYLRVLEDKTIKFSIRYGLDTEHGLEFCFTSGMISAVGGIAETWIAKRLGYSSSTAGWVNMIVVHTIGFKPKNISWKKFIETHISKEQHIQSVNFFYELLEGFKKENEQED